MPSRLTRLALAFMRLFFKHLYTTFAWAYDIVAWTTSMGQWQTWQSAALQSLPDGAILELGHGPGHLLNRLKQSHRLAFGIDISRQMTYIAARRLRRHGQSVVVVRARAQELPLPSNTFTCVLSTFPGEYILDSNTHKEIRRVLQDGGQAVLVGVARITGMSLPDRLAAWLYRVTGQAGEPHAGWKERLDMEGFEANLEIVKQNRADVLRFVMRKTVPIESQPE